MSTKNENELEEFVIGAGMYYVILAVIVSYPAFTIAYFLGLLLGVEVGSVFWVLGTAGLGILMHLEQWRIVMWLYIITLLPFIGIACSIFAE